MCGLEPNSHAHCRDRPIQAGRIRHPDREVLPRHRHRTSFAAVILEGGYVEAGDSGLHRVAPGDVLVHQPFESHVDRFGAKGAEVLTLPLSRPPPLQAHWRLRDVDWLVRLGERDPFEAEAYLTTHWTRVERTPDDWAEQLTAALLDDPDLSIRSWAEERGLHPGSIGRRFRQTFSLTAAAFRAHVRAHRAIRDISGSDHTLAQIAVDNGYADQSHLHRAILAITGKTPGSLRPRKKPK